MLKDQMTMTRFKGVFKNNFDLTNYAIQMAHHYLKAGHETSADEILEEVLRMPHGEYLEEEPAQTYEEEAEVPAVQ